MLFGHDDADLTTAWTTTEAPNRGTNIQRLAREWRLDETGDLEEVDFVVDVQNLPALPMNHTMYTLLVDADGDFRMVQVFTKCRWLLELNTPLPE